MENNMTRPSKEEYVRTHFPHYMKINALFEFTEIKKITEALIYAGFIVRRSGDQNILAVQNMILKMQKKFPNRNIGRNRTNNEFNRRKA